MNKTVKDIVQLDKYVIPGTWAAQAMGMDSSRLFGYAKEQPWEIKFPYQKSGKRLKIPRIPFLKYLGVTDEEIKNKKLR